MKLRTAFLLTLSLCAFVAAEANADQCTGNSNEIAHAGLAAIKAAGSIVPFCEPCGETAPGAPVSLRTAELRRAGLLHWEVVVNGDAVDLAICPAWYVLETGKVEFLA